MILITLTTPWRSALVCLLLSLPLLACSSEDTDPVDADPAAAAKAEAPTDGEFRMTVMDAFKITGRAMVVTGRVEAGTVRVGQSVCLSRQSGESNPVVVEGIEQFRKMLDSATAGEQVGLLLSDIEKDDVAQRDVILGEC